MINSFNPIQLSAWRANVDMQFIVSRHKVVQYCTKYVTKSEPRSQSLKDTFANITRTLKEGDRTVKAVQKLLINTVGERDYSAQETCHLLLQLLMYKASRSFITLSLMAQELFIPMYKREREKQLILCWITIHHVPLLHSSIPSLLDFTRQYNMPKELGAEPSKRSKGVIVIT